MLSTKESHDAVLQDLSDRKQWEERQRIFYQMRHTGIPRRSKPFPGAADLHFPLADSVIGKFVPFYFAQVYASDLLASFVAKDQAGAELARAAELFFDWQMNQRSNWFEEALATIDAMLVSGGGPLKVTWNAKRDRLHFDAVEPVFFVVPTTTMDLESAGRWTHILQLTEEQYKAQAQYNQDPEFIKRIKGAPQDERTQEKYRREGLTHTKSPEQIILWEIYQRTPEGIVVRTIAPNAPDLEVRPAFRLGPQHGETGGFVLFQTEHKDKGYYASRGVVEQVAAHETYLCRLWNEKADAMSFLNRPIFTSDNPLQNAAEIRFRPGEYVPNGLRSVPMGSPPIDFDNEMMAVRNLAEYRIAMPDYGIGSAEPGNDKRTATEVKAVGALMGVSIDLRARIFRRALGKAYRIAWSLLQHHKPKDLQVFVQKQAQQISPEIFAAGFEVEPDGSPDGWNKEQRVQRAYQRLQILGQSPFVKQEQLVRDALAEDSPALAERCFKDPQQAEQEALIAQARALAEVGINYASGGGADPAATQQIMQAGQQRVQALQQLNPQAAQQLMQELQQMAAQVQPQQPQEVMP